MGYPDIRSSPSNGNDNSPSASEYPVDQQGFVQFPLVSRVKASGLSVPQFTASLRGKLQRYLKYSDPQVKIINYRGNKFFIDGEVKQPGEFAIDDAPVSLYSAISRAGGATEIGDSNSIVLNRNGRSYDIGLSDLRQIGASGNQIYIQDGDYIHVNSQSRNTVYVLGEFGQIEPVPILEQGLSLAQVLGRSKGLNSATANAAKIYVVLNNPNYQRTNIYYIDMQTITNLALANRFEMQPNDILYVDPTGLGLALIDLGYHVHQITMQPTGTHPIKDIKTLFNSYKILNKIKPDYVLSYTIKPVIYGTLAAWLAKVPNRFVLISGLGYTFQQVEETNKRSFFQKFVHALYQQALAKSSKVFFQNKDDLNLFKKLNIVQLSIPTVVVNGSGVDLNDFKVMPLLRDESGCIKPSFLLIARLLKDKGVVEYVEAAKLIKKDHSNAEFHLVGWIDENPAAIEQTQLDQWIADGDIIYWGQLKDVRPAIAASSVYVLPSYREGTSRSVLEAMSMGRAIITTDAPGCREPVTSGKNGYLVPVQAIDELTAAMRQFIEHPNLYEQMGSASRSIAVDKYDVKKVNTHMIAEMGLA